MSNPFVMMLLACVGMLSGCGNLDGAGTPSAKAEYRRISSDKAMEMMSASEDFILLDVRTEEEFRETRIDGAMLIPDFEIKTRAEAQLPNKDALILVYCRTGRRSALAATELCSLGYTNVYDFGGILDWPHPTIKG